MQSYAAQTQDDRVDARTLAVGELDTARAAATVLIDGCDKPSSPIPLDRHFAALMGMLARSKLSLAKHPEGSKMTKLALCVGFTIALLAGTNFIPSVVYAQTDEEAAQPSESPETNNAAQPDQTATPDESAMPEEQSDDTQSESSGEPEDRGDERAPQDQE